MGDNSLSVFAAFEFANFSCPSTLGAAANSIQMSNLLKDCYAGFILSTIELHKRLIECIDLIDEETEIMYLNMILSFLCALNKMNILNDVEEKFGAKLHELPAPDMKKAAKYVFQVVGPPPEVKFDN